MKHYALISLKNQNEAYDLLFPNLNKHLTHFENFSSEKNY